MSLKEKRFKPEDRVTHLDGWAGKVLEDVSNQYAEVYKVLKDSGTVKECSAPFLYPDRDWVDPLAFMLACPKSGEPCVCQKECAILAGRKRLTPIKFSYRFKDSPDTFLVRLELTDDQAFTFNRIMDAVLTKIRMSHGDYAAENVAWLEVDTRGRG